MVDFADFCGRYIKSHYQLSDVKKSPCFQWIGGVSKHVFILLKNCMHYKGKLEIWCLSFDVEKIIEGRKSKNWYNMNTFTSVFQNKYKMCGVSLKNMKRELR